MNARLQSGTAIGKGRANVLLSSYDNSLPFSLKGVGVRGEHIRTDRETPHFFCDTKPLRAATQARIACLLYYFSDVPLCVCVLAFWVVELLARACSLNGWK